MKYFVTATDTDAGKTLISCGFLQLARQQGLSTLGLKPVAAGAEESDQGLVNEDALALQAASSLEPSYSEVNPLVFKAAIAPHLAAAEEGRQLNLERLAGRVRGQFLKKADLTLVEGAGGWRVPLQGQQTLADLARQLQLPVILVVRMQLGCLNHALLTAEAILRDGLPLAGWVANTTGEAMAREEENWQTLARLLPAPCLGRVPCLQNPDPETVSQYLQLPGSA
ncbi:dethiobiotin synthase [Marinospirillum perlucidum]|uniref:dethiobiotin synthase n=1 Tax=Marinospirillum perlucidum TaxID=1982602 RepID=UPI000DF1B5D2|nr:dethiobiotin synthase [Marinospirillum perlucidum]